MSLSDVAKGWVTGVVMYVRVCVRISVHFQIGGQNLFDKMFELGIVSERHYNHEVPLYCIFNIFECIVFIHYQSTF